jgi:polysaccharide biosynthesis/export protein
VQFCDECCSETTGIGKTPLAETIAVQDDSAREREADQSHAPHRGSFQSFGELWSRIYCHRRLFLCTVGTLLGACLLYCLVAPKEYEATARVALRGTQASVLTVDRADSTLSGSFASGAVQLETLANVMRSDQLAWDVITRLELYKAPGFRGSFARKFPSFSPVQASPEAKDWLLERFQRDLTAQTVPRTLVLQLRFRSRDAALSAAVLNALISAYDGQESGARILATSQATGSLHGQLKDLKLRVDRDDQKLAEFRRQRGILNAPEMIDSGQATGVAQSIGLSEVDAMTRELAAATADRIVFEAAYRAARTGDPELTMVSDPKLQGAGNVSLVLLQQLRGQRSELQQEQAKLRVEHGPNFPRVLEIQDQMQDLDQQIKAEDRKLVDRFKIAWVAAKDREQMVRKSLAGATFAGLRLNESMLKYAKMRQEANANRDVYLRLTAQAEEAGLAASSRGSELSVIDYARQPVEAVSPDLPVLMAITLFVGLWLGLAMVFIRDQLQAWKTRAAMAVLLIAATASMAHGQAPTPSTSGLPTGVARIPQSTETKNQPKPDDAPTVWNAAHGSKMAGIPPGAMGLPGMPAATAIGPGDLLQVSEEHSPEIHETVRVSGAGLVTLPLAGPVQVGGLDEMSAARAIETVLSDRGMLLHPQVTVLVTAYAGQDVSVLGEVMRPGMYTYSVHHRLLDLISSASGLSANAGRLVTITHRDDTKTTQPVALDPAGTDTAFDHNPELLPGDTVQVSRAGLVYIVGDVVRPGAFPVDPVQTTTVVQALTLAWGPGQNAALNKAVLIREQQGSRTVTTLDLKRMLRGLDPDVPIRDRDIVFVPNSMAKNLWNRTMESVIQSAAGVSIYAGMVYSQRF